MSEQKSRYHSRVDEDALLDAKLAGDYNLHDQLSPHAGSISDGKHFDVRRPSTARDGINAMGGGSWLQPSLTISENSSEVFCTRFSPDGRFLAAGCGDGAIRVFNTQTGRLAYNLQSGSAVALPVTALRFRPTTAQAKTKNVLVSVGASGTIQHWHMTSSKCLNTMKNDNQFYALDYRSDGQVFAVSGKDHVIRIYDEATKQETLKLAGGTGYGSSSTPGHSNRVFSIKFHPIDREVVLSGGWDNTIQVWDMRAGHSVRSIYGPHISGDSLDLIGHEILAGSWRPDHPLELWDYGSGELIRSIPWTKSSAAQPTLLYAAQFSGAVDGGRYIAAGGSGANEAKVFDHSNGDALVGTITGMSRGVFSIDFTSDGGVKKLAVAGGDASIRVIDIIEEEASSEKDESKGSGWYK